MHKIIRILFIIIALLMISAVSVKADTNQNINNNQYNVIIEDEADLLTDEEEKELKNNMSQLTEYGHVLFKTTKTSNGVSSLKYIQNYYYSILNNKPGVAFYIDMKNREVCACATGGLDRILTSGKCDTIMDNVYTYAKKGNYYKCAEETFSQMNRLLSGGKIAERMKYYCNAIVSAMISLFITYWIYLLYSKVLNNRKASNKELIGESKVSLNYTPINVTKTGSHREYSPQSSSSSGGGGFSGGGGGGGFSGSGGSHGF